MKCFAFDRDQTVDVNKGPVPLSLIKQLKGYHVVVAIGNQALTDEAGIEGFGGEYGRKPERLRGVRKEYPDCEEYWVIDDDDLSNMEEEEWKYLTPQEFVKKFVRRNESE